MKKIFFLCLVSLFMASSLYASQSSTITEVESYACMGHDKSKKQTEEEALANAKRKAIEFASTYITSETRVKDFQLEKDLISAYASATVTILQELEKSWYKDASAGDCFRFKIQAEVIPDPQGMARLEREKGRSEDPSAPLSVQVWTDEKEYKPSAKVRIYIKGNKPFYAKVLYKNVQGELLQILPNPYRSANYFHGGVVYEFPSPEDRFDLEVTPPFGTEKVIIYASTSHLGELDLTPFGPVYKIRTLSENIGRMTRGVALKEKNPDEKAKAAEFSEAEINIKTGI